MASSEASGRKLVVLGVPYNVDTQGLREYMEKFGALDDCIVLNDRSTGRSRGFGYVTYSLLADAQNVIQMKHTLGGRQLDVKTATPKEEMGKPTPPKASSTRVFVARVPASVKEEEFKRFFQSFGEVTDCYMPKGQTPGSHRNIGFVTFQDPATVDKILEEPRELDGATLAIDRATPKEDRFRGGSGGGGGGDGGGYRGGGAPGRPFRSYPPPVSPYDIMPALGGYGGGYPPSLALYGARDSPYGQPAASLGMGGGGHGAAAMAGAGGGGGGRPVHPTKIFVGKVPTEAAVGELRDYFSRFGPVEDVYLPKDASKTGHRGFAFVTFLDRKSVV